MLHRVSKGVILALGLYGLLLGACLFAPELMEPYLLPLFELPLFGLLFFGLVIPNSLIAALRIPVLLCTGLFAALAHSGTSKAFYQMLACYLFYAGYFLSSWSVELVGM